MYSATLLIGFVCAGLLFAISIAVVRTTASMQDEMRSVAAIRSEAERFIAARPDVREVRSTRVFKQARDRYYGEVEYVPIASDRSNFQQIVLYRDPNGSWSWREA